MALKPQLSFSTGELDPLLHDRVTLERFQNSLATARNVMIGKSGTVMSRFGRFHFRKSKYDNAPIKVYSPPNSSLLLEFGYDPSSPTDTYVDLYDFTGTLLHSFDGTIGSGGNPVFRAEDLESLHFETSKDVVYVFGGYNVSGSRYEITKVPLKVNDLGNWELQYSSSLLLPSTIVANSFVGVVGGTGYDIEYAWTAVYEGQETEEKILNATPVFKKPINVGEMNTMTINVGSDITAIESFNEIRIYQRPKEGSAFGFVGRTTNIYVDGAVLKAVYKDIGADPDFYNGLQTLISQEGLSDLETVGQNSIKTGTVYQQRLLLANFQNANVEAILASRPGYQNNFYRDFPYSANSALNFKAGTSGKAEVIRMIEYNGLVVFTTVGVFVSTGILSPDNLTLEKRGNWIIDDSVPPLIIPGGLFFVDKRTGAIKQLIYSQEISTYDSIDQSIFSAHLFKERTIKSWAFQDGVAPMVIVSFSDGTFATFTYSYEHQMRAWTRSDSAYSVEQVASTEIADTTIFVTNKNGNRYIEMTVPRYILPSVYVENPEAGLTAYSAFMDGLKVKVDLLNDDLIGVDELDITPVVSGDWEGNLTLTCGTSGIFTAIGDGQVGTIFRFFNPKDKSKLDLTVVSRTDDDTVVVSPSEEFPSDYANDIRLYRTFLTVDGLQHLEGEIVSVMVDGDVVSSPFNDNSEDTLSAIIVSGGDIDLPERAAIAIVGRPIVADIKTLNVSTAEQSPTMIESLNINKLYVRVKDSRGLFVDNKFPEENDNEVDGTSVEGMQSLDTYYVPSNTSIIGNRSKPGTSKRIEVIIPGEWENNGQMALRQVDPLHFEILSIVADIEILPRSNR